MLEMIASLYLPLRARRAFTVSGNGGPYLTESGSASHLRGARVETPPPARLADLFAEHVAVLDVAAPPLRRLAAYARSGRAGRVSSSSVASTPWPRKTGLRPEIIPLSQSTSVP